jgi:hypothetical protein
MDSTVPVSSSIVNNEHQHHDHTEVRTADVSYVVLLPGTGSTSTFPGVCTPLLLYTVRYLDQVPVLPVGCSGMLYSEYKNAKQL